MTLIDTHAHLYAEEFQSDLPQVLEQASAQGVKRIYMPNVDQASIEPMLVLEQKYPGLCVPMMGLHPCYVKENFEEELKIVEGWLNKRKFSAIGEIGTDLYWDKTFYPQQEEALRVQLGWAKQYQLPIVIHCRNSIRETIDIIKSAGTTGLSGVFHCFSGNLEEAKEVIDMGFFIGIGGVATFKNGGMDKVLPFIDTQDIVLETDCPYLAPVPHRGKRNEPAYIKLVAQRVADLKEMSLHKLEEITTANALRLFNDEL